MDMSKMLKQAKKMQQQLADVQDGLKDVVVEATAGGGMVKATMTGDGQLTGITIDPDSFEVRKNGAPVDLTQREYELLTFLASHPGKVFSRVDLMEQVWNYGYVGDDARTVDVTVRRLREKIEDDPANPTCILTRRGVGYYFAAQA